MYAIRSYYVHRVARRIALRLGVVGDADRLFRVRSAVDVDVADAVQVLDHRHPGILGDALDQPLAAAGDDDVV